MSKIRIYNNAVIVDPESEGLTFEVSGEEKPIAVVENTAENRKRYKDNFKQNRLEVIKRVQGEIKKQR